VAMLLVNGVALALHVRRGPGAGRWCGLAPAHRGGGAAPVAE